MRERKTEQTELNSMGTTENDGYCGKVMEGLGEVGWHGQYAMPWLKVGEWAKKTPDCTELDNIVETGESLQRANCQDVRRKVQV